MTEHKRTSDFVVGITVLFVTAVLLAVVLWVKQADLGRRKSEIIVRTRDVGGVALGNPVVIRGVRAGQVQGIALGERGWVVLTLGIDKSIPLPSDPVVLLVASSLFGEWQATVSEYAGVPPDRELRAALAEARTSGDTLAGAMLPDIAQLTSVAGRISGDVAKVADRVQVAFDDKAAKELPAQHSDMSLLDLESGGFRKCICHLPGELEVGRQLIGDQALCQWNQPARIAHKCGLTAG